MPYDAIKRYKEQSIYTMSKGEQLILLFDEVLKNLHYGSMMLKDKNYATANKCTQKCKKIFNYLSAILDSQYSISDELSQLYDFANQQVIAAEIKHDPTILDELIPLVENMKDTWVQAEKLCHMK